MAIIKGSPRTYVVFTLGFGLAFLLMFFTSPLLNRRTERHPLAVLREPFIPQSPHSHGEFDEAARRLGKMKARNWLDASEHSHVGEDMMAKQLAQKVRVFCWIMTSPSNHKTKAVHVKATWAKRCNKFIFVSSKEDKSLPSINLNVAEGRDHLWGKTKAAFRYLYDKELNNFDFFMKADDDTYVVLENLRYMLRNVKASDPILFGRKFKMFVKQGYMSGGAGYVISREGLRRIVEQGFGKHKRCRRDEGGAEDVHFGECAEAVGVLAGDSRDSLGRERFHPFPPDSHFQPIDKGNWLWSYNFYPLKTGPECCSDTSVSYHYITPQWMYVLEYFVYHWHPYGVVRDFATVRLFMQSEGLAHPAAAAAAAAAGSHSNSLHESLDASHQEEVHRERRELEAEQKRVLKMKMEAEVLHNKASEQLKEVELERQKLAEEAKRLKALPKGKAEEEAAKAKGKAEEETAKAKGRAEEKATADGKGKGGAKEKE